MDTTAPAPADSAADAATRPDPRPAAVLWDMDGTLVDTEPHWIAAETAMLAAHGVSWTHEQALALVGSALPDSGRVLAAELARAGVHRDPDDLVEELVDAVIARIGAAVEWRPGALDLLTALTAAQVPCALVTMSYRRLADAVAERLPGAFAVIVTGDEVTRGKPAPDPYLRAAEVLGLDPGDCVAIEDSPTGLASAEAAGCVALACPHLVDIPPAPARNRVASLTQVDVATLGRMAGGQLVDLLTTTSA